MNDPSYFVQGALVNKEDSLEGAYFARATSELILIINEDLSSYKKAYLFKEAADDLLKGILSRGIKSTHLFITPESDTHHEELLAKHFGFVRATGIPLYWEID